MKCLCCGKEFDNSITLNKQSAQWHQSCVKKFFGTKTLPDIDISEQVLEQLAVESTAKGYTVPGVQKKLSLHLSEENRERPRLTLVNYPTGYILKPQTAEYRALPEAEYLVMSMAHITKIQTVPYALLQISADDHSMAYITKRIDRIRKSNQLHMLAMEDFCQLENRLTADKYKGSYERCAKVIARYSQTAGLDMAELFLRIVFSFAVGNSDMHLKNFSLIETSEGSGLYHLSSAESVSKYHLLRLFQQEFGRDDITVREVDGLLLDKSLVNTRSDFSFEMRDYPHQIADMRRWIEIHHELYPHYHFQ